MRRPAALAALSCLLVVLCLAAGAQERPDATPSFRATTEVVTVDVVVTDRKGAPVVGLGREDFTLAENGVRQEVTAFEAVHQPAPAVAAAAPQAPVPRTSSNLEPAAREARNYVVVFDELHLDPAEAQRSRVAVSEFLKRGVADRDRVTLVGTAEGTSWTARMPQGREALLTVLGRLQGRRVVETVKDAMTDWEALRIDREHDPITTDRVMRRFQATGYIRQETRLPGDPPDRGEFLDSYRDQVRSEARQAYARAAARNEQTLGIVERCLASLGAARGRKALVLVSGGFVYDSRLAAFRRAVNESRRANVAVYFLDSRGLGSLSFGLAAETGTSIGFNDLGAGLSEGGERSEGSAALAADTGGFSVTNQNDLAGGLERIGRESRSYYLLGYTPSDKRTDGSFRSIGVEVAREGVSVRARRGYYAPDGKPAAPVPAQGRDAAIQRALDSPFDLAEIPLRAIAQVFAGAVPGQASVLVTTEVDIRGLAFDDKTGAAKDALEFLLIVAQRETGEYHRIDQKIELSLKPETRARFNQTWFPITREVSLAPGSFQAKLVIRDQRSGRIGTLTHDFEVPDLAGLRISSLMLSDRLREEAAGGARSPELIARRTFAPTGILHGRFEVYGAAKDSSTGQPNLTAGFSIRRSDGRFLAAMPATPLTPGPDGTLARALGTPLEGAPPGSYEMIVVVTDLVAGRAAEAREPFEILAPSGR
jgi:VWFA-related protein